MPNLYHFIVGAMGVGFSIVMLLSNRNKRTEDERKILKADIEMGYVTEKGMNPKLLGALFLLLGLAMMYYYLITRSDDTAIWKILISGIIGVAGGAFLQLQRNHSK